MSMILSRADRVYLKKKHQGGISNKKGNRFEDFYATYTIADSIKKYRGKLDKVTISSQIKSYIDDLLLVDPEGTKSYFQIKDVKSLTWNTGGNRGHALKDDFAKQIALKKDKEKFLLFLVCANYEKKLEIVPDDVKSYTKVVFFTSGKDISSLLQSNKTFHKAIENICLVNNPTEDILYGIAQSILGVWVGCNQNNETIQLLLGEIMFITNSHVPILGIKNVKPNKVCKNILNSLNVPWILCSGYLVFLLPMRRKLEFEWNENFQQRIISKRPSSLIDIFIM